MKVKHDYDFERVRRIQCIAKWIRCNGLVFVAMSRQEI